VGDEGTWDVGRKENHMKLSLSAGIEQQRLGLYATELNNQDFVNKARSIARELSLRHGFVNMDMVRTDPRLQELQPSSNHVFGAIFQGKEWQFIGYERSALRSNRARRIVRWRYQA
jgi:hypothetical protein